MYLMRMWIKSFGQIYKIDNCIDALADFGRNTVNMRGREKKAEVIDIGKENRGNNKY